MLITLHELTRRFTTFLLVTGMPESPTTNHFTIDELAQLLALSRFSRRPIKRRLNDKGLADGADDVTHLLAQIQSHPQIARIQQIAFQIEDGMRRNQIKPRKPPK